MPNNSRKLLPDESMGTDSSLFSYKGCNFRKFWYKYSAKKGVKGDMIWLIVSNTSKSTFRPNNASASPLDPFKRSRLRRTYLLNIKNEYQILDIEYRRNRNKKWSVWLDVHTCYNCDLKMYLHTARTVGGALHNARTVGGSYQFVSSSMNPTRRGTTVYSLRAKKKEKKMNQMKRKRTSRISWSRLKKIKRQMKMQTKLKMVWKYDGNYSYYYWRDSSDREREKGHEDG